MIKRIYVLYQATFGNFVLSNTRERESRIRQNSGRNVSQSCIWICACYSFRSENEKKKQAQIQWAYLKPVSRFESQRKYKNIAVKSSQRSSNKFAFASFGPVWKQTKLFEKIFQMIQNTKNPEHQKETRQYWWSKLSDFEKDFHFFWLDSAGKQARLTG